jgi:probable phosphoglycerate mutase
VWCSPLARARALGEAIAARLRTGVTVRDELREIHRGRWQGLAVTEIEERFPDEVRAFYADPWSFRAHEGECDALVAARANRALDDVLARHAGGVVVLATHYNVLRVLVAGALGIPPERSFALRVDPGRSVLLVDGPERWLLLGSNVWDPAASPGARTGATA